MAPMHREQLITAIVVGGFALGLLFSALILGLALFYQRPKRARMGDTMSRTTLERKPSLDYSTYFQPWEEKPLPSSPAYFCQGEQSRDSSFPSPTTPDWLARPLMLSPPTPAMHAVHSSVEAHVVYGWEACPASITVPPSRLPVCYSPSVYSIPSWRDSTTTLFEEDIQPVGLGIERGVEE